MTMTNELFAISKAVKKLVPSKKIKVDVSNTTGTVTITYKDKDVKVQRMYQSLKKFYRENGFSVSYNGKSFSVTADDTSEYMEDQLIELRNEGLELLSLLK